MSRSIAIRIAEEISEQSVPIRLFAAARTSHSVPLTYYSSPQHINVRVVHETAHPIKAGV